jgi:DNA-binding CsgD family transcriptional regulator
MRGKDDFPFAPVMPEESKASLRQRVEGLFGDELQGYKWLREFYSEQWIAETLLLDKRQIKELIQRICRKLGVRNVKALLRVYGRLERPKDVLVRTEEIDSYVEKRLEKAIQEEMQKSRSKSPKPGKSTAADGDKDDDTS